MSQITTNIKLNTECLVTNSKLAYLLSAMIVNNLSLKANEFFLNYTKLAMLAIKSYIGKSKIKSAKKLGLNRDPL